MRSSLFDSTVHETHRDDPFVLQSPQVLRVRLGASVMATRGTTFAHRGEVTFTHAGVGGVAARMKQLVSGGRQPLMSVAGSGEVWLAHQNRTLHLIDLESEAITVAGASLVAFQQSLEYRIDAPEEAAEHFWTVSLRGTGRVAVAVHGTPLVLDCAASPTFVDLDSAVCWSLDLAPVAHQAGDIRTTHGAPCEGVLHKFHGPGFVVAQPPGACSGR